MVIYSLYFMNTLELLEIFKKELLSDTKIDALNILDRQMMQPAIRHKWVARLIDAKQSRNKANKKKKEIRRQVLEVLECNLPKGLPKAALDSKIESSEKMQTINDEIDDTELLIDYLERVEKIFASLTYDFSTMQKLISMEES